MKEFFIGCFFMTLSVGVLAQKQETTDSIYLFKQSLLKLNDSEQNAASLLANDDQNVSIVSLNYKMQKGHFRTAQTAESGYSIAFQSSGVKTLGRFKMAGYFDFERTWQDSLAWTMQGVPDDATPYYFAAGKAGKYERLHYKFGGLLTYGLIKDKLFLAAGADYDYNTASRSVDPRPSVQTFQLLVNPQLLYQQGNHVIGAELNLGYGKENNSISYMSKQYSAQSPDYPDRINYLLMGYGYQIPFGAGKIERQHKTRGFGLNYAYHMNQAYINTGVNYSKQTQDNLNAKDQSANNNKYGTFILNSYNARLLTGLKTAAYQHQLQVTMQFQDGYDHNYLELFGLSNYKYNHQNIGVDYTILRNSNAAQKIELGFNLVYNSVNKKDIASDISTVFGYIQPALNSTLYNSFSDKSRLSITLSPGLRLPAGNAVHVPVTDNVFANNIIYPDYTYYTSTAGTLNFKVKYSSPHLIKNTKSGLSLNIFYINSLSDGKKPITTGFNPSKNRLDVSLGFNLYF